MNVVQGSIEAVRSIAGELGIKPGAAITVLLRSTDPATLDALGAYEGAIKRLTRAQQIVRELAVEQGAARPRGVGYAVSHGVEVMVPLAGHIDPATEGKRLNKDVAKTRKEADGIAKRLENKDFIARAPADVVDKDRAKLSELRDREARLLAAIDTIREL